MQATQAGMFPSLGDGIVRLAEVIEVLEAGGYDGWYVMETDVAITDGVPADGEGPVLGVARSLDFLRSLQLVSS
jgi:inosose dehydratase